MTNHPPIQDTLNKIEKAQEMVAALCKPRGTAGAREWMMSIPARPDYDPDLVIADALRAAKQALARAHPTPGREGLIEKLEKTIERAPFRSEFHRGWSSAMSAAIAYIREHQADHIASADKMVSSEIRYITALKSIAANTCCDRCQEAALVAKAALDGSTEPVSIKRATEAFLRETDVFGGTTGAGLRRAFESVGVKYHEN